MKALLLSLLLTFPAFAQEDVTTSAPAIESEEAYDAPAPAPAAGSRCPKYSQIRNDANTALMFVYGGNAAAAQVKLAALVSALGSCKD